MKTVLAVDADAPSRAAMTEALRLYCPELSVLVAEDAPMAVHLMRRRRVDLVLTALRPPRLDEFQLLAYLLNRYPKIPALVMSLRDWSEPAPTLSPGWVPSPLTPEAAEELASLLRHCLERRELGHTLGVTLPGLLQLLHQEGVTGMLQVASGQRRGVLLLQGGELVHARSHGVEGNAAAFQVLSWPQPRLLLLGHRRDMRHTLTVRTSLLLKLLSHDGALASLAPPSGKQQTRPQMHHAPPGPAAVKAARRARPWTQHANSRLNWWDSKPSVAWKWWPAAAKTEQGEEG